MKIFMIETEKGGSPKDMTLMYVKRFCPKELNEYFRKKTLKYLLQVRRYRKCRLFFPDGWMWSSWPRIWDADANGWGQWTDIGTAFYLTCIGFKEEGFKYPISKYIMDTPKYVIVNPRKKGKPPNANKTGAISAEAVQTIDANGS